MNEMMEKMVAGMMKPEDMPQIMNAMMERMFSGVSMEDRKEFLATMMPKCLKMIFAELSPDASEKLAGEMVGRTMDVFKEQLGTAEEQRKGAVASSGSAANE